MQTNRTDKTPNKALQLASKSAQRVRDLFRTKEKAAIAKSDSSSSTDSGDSLEAPAPANASRATPALTPWYVPAPKPPIRDICVFAGGSKDADLKYLDAANLLGAHMGYAKIDLIFGGGRDGLMGGVAQAVLTAGCRAKGVFVGKLAPWTVAPQISRRFTPMVARDFETRKNAMVEAADAVVVLPGGWGTLDEYAFMMNRAPGTKKMVFVNTDGYFTPLREFVATMKKEGFAYGPLPVLRDTPRQALAYLLGGSEARERLYPYEE